MAYYCLVIIIDRYLTKQQNNFNKYSWLFVQMRRDLNEGVGGRMGQVIEYDWFLQEFVIIKLEISMNQQEGYANTEKMIVRHMEGQEVVAEYERGQLIEIGDSWEKYQVRQIIQKNCQGQNNETLIAKQVFILNNQQQEEIRSQIKMNQMVNHSKQQGSDQFHDAWVGSQSAFVIYKSCFKEKLQIQASALQRGLNNDRIVKVVRLEKYGFFNLFSNKTVIGYFNDHSILKYLQFDGKQSRMNEKDEGTVNKQNILSYIVKKYFKQAIKRPQQIRQSEECDINKLFFKDGILFVRLTNGTIQTFLSTTSQQYPNQPYQFNTSLTFNNNPTSPAQILFTNRQVNHHFKDCFQALQDKSCQPFLQYIRQCFQIILNNSQISLNRYHSTQ